MRAREHLPKRYRDGTHRLVSPQETLARVRPLLLRLGITRVANVTGLDRIGIPVVMTCRPNSRSISVSQGKGLDLDAAKASAIMENVEGYHAERIRLPLMLASYEELVSGHHVVDVDRLPRADDSLFHPRLPLLWVQGRDWMCHEDIWVPFQLVHTAYIANLRSDLNCFAASSSGLASGNHLVEAASHAICEVIERDACFRFHQLSEEEQDGRRLDLDSVDDPHCRALLERFQRARVSVSVWDATSPAGFPVFMAMIAETADDSLRRLYAAEGSGCHPVRHIALVRALTEAAQSRLTAISGARDDMFRRKYLCWREPATLRRMSEIASSRGQRPFAAVPSFQADSLEEDLEWELGSLRRAGFHKVIMIDLTLPEFGIPVVRTIIPGMQRIGGRNPAGRAA
jgi:ribosomal protein S12 methylthiotransferase accessory factor